MKLRSLFSLFCLTALTAIPCLADENLLLNGAFESWKVGCRWIGQLIT